MPEKQKTIHENNTVSHSCNKTAKNCQDGFQGLNPQVTCISNGKNWLAHNIICPLYYVYVLCIK